MHNSTDVAGQELETYLCDVTGFHACSLQPNSGAAGEYAGLSVIRAYHESRGEGHRDICLIPVSAHGTNPAVSVLRFFPGTSIYPIQSAVLAGLKVVPVKSLQDGSLDLVDLKEKAEKHRDNLAAFMVRPACTHLHGGLINPPRSLIHPHSASLKTASLTCVDGSCGCHQH